MFFWTESRFCVTNSCVKSVTPRGRTTVARGGVKAATTGIETSRRTFRRRKPNAMKASRQQQCAALGVMPRGNVRLDLFMAQLRENGPIGDNSAVLKIACYGAAAALCAVTMAANLKFGHDAGQHARREGHLRHRQRGRRRDSSAPWSWS